MAAVCCSFYFGQIRLSASLLLSAALHELAHILMAMALGLGIRKLELTWTGARLTTDETTNYFSDVLLCLSGPLVNLALAFRTDNALFAGTNLLLALLNLMPIRGLDGGNALYAALAWGVGPIWAERICFACSVLWAFAAVLGGGVVLCRGGAPWLMLLGSWLLLALQGNKNG